MRILVVEDEKHLNRIISEAVEDEENQKAVRLLISRVKYLLHHLRFRKFEGRLAFGFEDPAMVGRTLAVLSLFYPLYGERFTITPVFPMPCT